MSTRKVFKPKKHIGDQETAGKLDLSNNCLLFYAAWSVYWMRTESENLIVSAKRADKETLLELFRIESIKMQLPIGCGLATICGEHSDYNNVCVLFRYSDESRDFDSLLKYKGEMSDFAGAVILSKKNGHTINEILELAG